MRRDFIANAAHELRTPLTNLQGYLEALRDGVIVADRATYDSLREEAERLVRLSRSLDALAEGDAATSPPALVRIDLAGGDPDAPLELAQPALERAGLHARRSMSRDACPPGRTRTISPRSSRTCCRTRPATRRPAAPSRSGPSAGPRPPRLDRQHRRAASRRRTSTASSSASIGSRSRATGRAAARASGWRSSSSWSRPGGGRVGASRATARPGSGSASRPERASAASRACAIATIPTAIPASPTTGSARGRSPRNATATRIVTAGPNDAASPTIQVGAGLEADRERRSGPTTSSSAGQRRSPRRPALVRPGRRRRSVARARSAARPSVRTSRTTRPIRPRSRSARPCRTGARPSSRGRCRCRSP